MARPVIITAKTCSGWCEWNCLCVCNVHQNIKHLACKLKELTREEHSLTTYKDYLAHLSLFPYIMQPYLCRIFGTDCNQVLYMHVKIVQKYHTLRDREILFLERY
jgi:hypothetical protein